MPEKNHPDFDSAPPENRWTGNLVDLGKTLREKAWKGRGASSWFILPRGALVSMRVRPEDFLKELRIARRHAPEPKWQAAWDHECRVFLEHLGCTGWQLQPARAEGAGADKVYLEVRRDVQAELLPTPETCVRCGAPAAKGMYKEALCTRCAMRAGSEETAQLRRGREPGEP